MFFALLSGVDGSRAVFFSSFGAEDGHVVKCWGKNTRVCLKGEKADTGKGVERWVCNIDLLWGAPKRMQHLLFRLNADYIGRTFAATAVSLGPLHPAC